MRFKVITEPGEQSGFVSHVPALPGCWSQGATRKEALLNVREAAEVWLEAQQSHGDGKTKLTRNALNPRP